MDTPINPYLVILFYSLAVAVGARLGMAIERYRTERRQRQASLPSIIHKV